MKTILIATDFSHASRNASLYGVELARSINANVILFNAYTTPRPLAGLQVGVSRFGVMVETDQKLLDEADVLDADRSLIESVCDEGPAAEAILNIANERKVDFIITGMQSNCRNFKKLLGSTTTSLAKITNIPLIVVPGDASFKRPETIVFATDNSETKNELPGKLKTIAELFASRLYVVKILKEKNEDWFQIKKQSAKRGRIVEISDHSYQYPVNTNPRLALGEFVLEHSADMLVMTSHKHKWLERDMIFHTTVPLLILPAIHASHSLVFDKEMGLLG